MQSGRRLSKRSCIDARLFEFLDDVLRTPDLINWSIIQVNLDVQVTRR